MGDTQIPALVWRRKWVERLVVAHEEPKEESSQQKRHPGSGYRRKVFEAGDERELSRYYGFSPARKFQFTNQGDCAKKKAEWTKQIKNNPSLKMWL